MGIEMQDITADSRGAGGHTDTLYKRGTPESTTGVPCKQLHEIAFSKKSSYIVKRLAALTSFNCDNIGN